MSSPSHAEYYAVRCLDAQILSASATNANAAAAHADMAARYERAAAQFDPHRAQQSLPSDAL